MIEQPQAPRIQSQESDTINTATSTQSISGGSELNDLFREVKQLRQDVQFLKQLLEHVQQQLK